MTSLPAVPVKPWPSCVERSKRTWALAKGCNLSYQNKETILFTVDPDDGNLNA